MADVPGLDSAVHPQEAAPQDLESYRQFALGLFRDSPPSGPIHYSEMNCSKINILDGEARRRERGATRLVPRRHFCPLPSWESQQELSCQESRWGCKTMFPSVPSPHFLILGILTKEGTLNQIIMLCQSFMLSRNICLRNHTLWGESPGSGLALARRIS